MTWEGLFVALSRVEMKDHIRLAIKNNIRHNLKYIADLTKNKYTDSFFCGFKHLEQNSQDPMVWDRKTAWEAAGFEKVFEETKAKAAREALNKKRNKHTMHQNRGYMKKRRLI